jgi:glycosyltransferase involved in cell wall biosynthesis
MAHLPRAIASVGRMADHEIVVLDDGSVDGSRDWLARAAQSDGRLRVLVGPGAGPAKARNMAIGAARGRLLAFLDVDDRWHEGKLQAQLALHRDNPELAFSFTGYRDVSPEGDVLAGGFANCRYFQTRHGGHGTPFVLEDDALAQIYAEPVVETSTVIARTDLVRELGGFDPDLPATEDWDLWLRLAARGRVGCVPQILADHAVQAPDRAAGMARGQVIGMQMIAARHAAAAERLNARAVRIFAARLLNADADLAMQNDRRWRAAWLRMNAWRQSPSRTARRAAAGAVLHAMALL